MQGFISARAQATPAITNMTEAKHGSTLRCIVPLLLTSSRRTRSRNVNATACPHLPRTDKRPRSSNMTSPVSPPRAFELHRADWSAGIRSLCAGSASGAAHSLWYPGLRAALATLPAPYQSSASVSAAFQVISTPTGRPRSEPVFAPSPCHDRPPISLATDPSSRGTILACPAWPRH